jgi:hypothetical protein
VPPGDFPSDAGGSEQRDQRGDGVRELPDIGMDVEAATNSARRRRRADSAYSIAPGSVGSQSLRLWLDLSSLLSYSCGCLQGV